MMDNRGMRWFFIKSNFLLLIQICFFCGFIHADVLQMDESNFDGALNQHELVIVNFYADWCRFSQHLKPTFLETSDKFKDKVEVLFGAVDSDKEATIAQKYHVNKYPTIKLFRFGELIKKEYRAQRSVEAIEQYVRKQLESPIQQFTSKDDLNTRIDNSKRNVIAYFSNTMILPAYSNFYKAASSLRDECVFWLGTGDWVNQQHSLPDVQQQYNNASILFREPNSGSDNDFQYTGPLEDYDYLKKWLIDKCVPLVREITFENAEELTEEGLPFLILFRKPGDTQSEQQFTSVVTTELADQKNAINFLMADGKRFAHPLSHLGKSERDLPVIAIDSFRHMYLFPAFQQLGERGKLRQFVMDLHSGKLHREFHQGTDPTSQQPHEQMVIMDTQPPPSVFKKLKPSENRYSLLDKTEL